jgi:hypothetical protein
VIRVEVEESYPPGWHKYLFRHGGAEYRGKSRIPLLTACRHLERIGANRVERVGMFRGKSTEPDLTCVVGYGAKLVVKEGRRDAPKFAKWDMSWKERL